MPAEKPNKKMTKAQEDARAALAKFREQIDQLTHDLLINAHPEQLTRPDLTAEILKGNTIPASVWTFGPGSQHFSALFDERLTAIARYMKIRLVEQQVAKLDASFLTGTDILVMYPAQPTDETAYKIRRQKNGAIIVNLSDLLIAQGVSVEANHKELRRVVLAPEESPLFPALIVNYAQKPQDRKYVPRSTGDSDGDAEKDDEGQ